MANTNSAVPEVAEKKAKRGAQAPKEAPASKKPKSKGTRSYPSFVEMISDAILALKERTGSSQYAINKFIEDKHKQLPPNFRKLLLFHLKKLVAAGKLVKVKNSFKLPSARSAPAPAKAKKPIDSKSAKVVAKPKAKVAAKPKAKTAAAADKKLAAKPKAKASEKARMAAKPAAVTSPGKKKAVKKVVPAKKVKSVKSPVGKRARR